MKILLTGGAGYIGSNTALSLLENGHSVSVVDSLVTGTKKLIPPQADYYKCDIADVKSINEILKKNVFDIVMHFAGLTKVDESVKNPEKYMFNNYEKSKMFLNCCFENNLKKIIFSSTAGVYGDVSSKNLKETDNLKPINPYAISKSKIEDFLVESSQTKNIYYTILRYFNVAGADKKNRTGLIAQNSNNLIKVICEVALEKREKITINGNDYKTKDGTPIRDFIHVEDLSDMHLNVAEKLKNNNQTSIYNCGYGTGYSVGEVINEMEKILKRNLKKEYGPRRKNDIPYSVADNKKFQKKFNWMPKYNDLSYILKSALEWEKKIK